MEFRLLGTLEVLQDDRQLTVGTIKHKALLAILLLHANEVVATDVLVDELWAGSPPPRAHATLRAYVSGLRQALEPGVRAGSHSLIETRPSGYLLGIAPDRIDVRRFDALVRDGRAGLRERRWEEAAGRFQEALALWRGPAFGDFTYHRFAGPEAARLAETRLAAEEGRMTAELALGRHREVVGELATLAESAPFREHVWGLWILALYRCGRQGEALRTYQRLRQALGEELGIEPSAELRQLEQSVLAQDIGLDWTPSDVGASRPRAPAASFPLQSMLATGDRTVFVGRELEEDALRALWARAVAGSRLVALVSGEAGIGKSRLAAEVARAANAEGGIVLYGRCDEELLVPHQPFIEALGHYVSECSREDLEAHLGSTGPELIRLLPEVGRLLPDLPEPPPAEPETQRYRLFDAVTELLSALATSAPVLLVLDDLHWADKPTLLLLRHLLLRGRDDVPLLILGIHRGDEPGATDGLADVLADVRRRRPVERIVLGGLSDDDIAGVLGDSASWLPGGDTLAVAQAIRRETAGNPLFVEEIVGHLRETGALDETTAPNRRAPGIISAIGLPEGVREVVTRRLSRLSPDARETLTVASVIGADFEVDLMQAAGGLAPDSLLDAIEQARSARLVMEVTERGDRYSFCHQVVRDSIYSGLTGARRAQLHRRVAGALEELAAGDPEARLAPTAFHLSKAGAAADAAKTIDCARRAAKQALAQVAYEQAALHYRQALEAQERQARSDPALRCQLLLSLGEAHNKAGELPEAKAVFLLAAETARRLGATEQLGQAALGYGGPVPVAASIEDATSVELVEEALGALDEQDSACRALLTSRLAQWRYRSSPAQERRSLCEQALDMARRLDDPNVLACVLSNRNWALFGPEDLQDRIVAGQEIIDLGRRLGNDELVLEGLQCLVHGYLELGDIRSLGPAVVARDGLAEELRQPQYLWNVIVSKALDAIVQGRFADAGTLVERALATRYRADPRQASNVYLAQQFILYFLQGRLGEQAEALTQLVQKYPSEMVRRSVGGWFLAEVGQRGAAAASLDAITVADLVAVPRDLDFYPTVAGATVASFRLGDARLGPTLYDMLLPFATRNCIVGQSSFLGAASHYLGLLARLTGRPEAAVSHLEAALARHQEMGAEPFAALTEDALAGALRDVGGAERETRADELLGHSRATAARLGMAGLSQHASDGAGGRG